MQKKIKIGDKYIGEGCPCFVIAEMSGNHNLEYETAEKILRMAKEAGVDAIKLQTYTADTITLDANTKEFYTNGLWTGQTLYNLYKKAYTPWEWQPRLKKIADSIGIILFSSPFDETAVDFLEEMDVPAYKIASFEINDIGLLRKVAKTGKPIIISTGIASLSDISLAIETCKKEGNDKIILLKCTSEYPAPYKHMNLSMISNMKQTFGVPVGLSDHSLGDEIAIAAVALGANVIEKHLTIKRDDGGVDAEFSMEAEEMAHMVNRIRHVEDAVGEVSYELSAQQIEERRFGRSLYSTRQIHKGEIFDKENIRSVRPGNGLHTKYLEDILGKKATRDIDFATPLTMEMIEW